ncbi:UNVERIFIED_CONTAM: ATPase subunit of ABC transporter with duplicated ATPase domains [Acetivibrio alkalicellulosi]
MIDIKVQDLNKYYGSNHIIKGISFEILKGEKVGLLGKNGSGKTTLFKVLSEREQFESGTIYRASGKIIEILDQIPVVEDKYTVEDVLQNAFEDIFILSDEMRRLEGLIEKNHLDERLINRYGKLQTEYEGLGGYDFESKIDKICNGMKISSEMRIQLFNSLSQGEKTRVNLARILLRNSDILLLDEPTNHLDMESIKWLEDYLSNFTGTVIAVSHDRCFLDNVVSRIIEIHEGELSFYEGNYSFYVEEKERRYSIEKKKYEQQQKKIHQLQEAAKRMHEWAKNADNPSMHKRAFSIEKRIERIDKIDKPVVEKKIKSEFKEKKFSSDEIVVFSNVSKGYDDKLLFSDLTIKIRRNDRIAIVGNNGCGKSTLIKLITGDEAPQKGNIVLSNSINMAYMPQVIEFNNVEATVLETIRYEFEVCEDKGRKILSAFRFKGKDVFKKVGMLSGGEKSRLRLCMLMQSEINFLLLDEPTNHLDIYTRRWIEDAVSQFNGTMLFISHDRYFINKFATRIWDISQGEIYNFDGTFSKYCEWKQKNMKLPKKPVAKTTLTTKSKHSHNKDKSCEEAKAKDIQNVENQIFEAENKLKKLCDEMNIVTSDSEKLNSLYEKKLDIEKEIDLLYNKWGFLTQ